MGSGGSTEAGGEEAARSPGLPVRAQGKGQT
jgi:hypothetical protein